MPGEVSQVLGRDLSTVARHYNRLDGEEDAPKLGRPPALAPKQEEQIVKTASSITHYCCYYYYYDHDYYHYNYNNIYYSGQKSSLGPPAGRPG